MAVAGDLKGETESEIIAAQRQALQTKYHVTKILQTETDSKCRLSKQFDAKVDTHHTSKPNIGKRITHKEIRLSVCSATL